MPCFSVLTLCHTYAHSDPNSDLKRKDYRFKNGYILLENVLYKVVVTCVRIAYLIFSIFLIFNILSVATLWYRYARSHPNNGSKSTV